MLKKFHIFLLLIAYCLSGNAQTFPVTISTQFRQPSPIYLSNYADAITINSPIKVQLVLNDLTISNRQVRLKCYFQGGGVTLVSNDYVVGAKPLYLEGGFPLQLTNVELAPYFEFQNILGINPNQYAQALPEGIYNFYVEVYDFATGKKLSRKTGVTTIIFQNEPPFLNLPLNNAGIMEQNIQNIIFSWTPRSINVSNVEYEFSLVEIWDNYTPVQNAFAYSPPLYTTTTRNTTLQYSIAEPQLITGKRYAWRVKAKALLGAEEIGVFKNNGYSEIYSFKYLTQCNAPLAITTTDLSQDQAKITWSGAIDNYDYQVNYREKNADSKWYKLVTPREYLTISNLKANATYEYTVGAACDLGEYTHSNVQEFTTLARDEVAFSGCNLKPDPADLSNQTPLPALFPNDVVKAGDFPIVVLKTTGGNGTFSGEGYVTLPFLEKFRKLIDAADALGGEKIDIGKFSRIRITFNNIGINTDFKLISGEIVASYDKAGWDNNFVDGDKLANDLLGDNGTVVVLDVDIKIESVVKNPDGTVTITGTNGVVVNQPKTVNDVIITDKDGKQFAVPANAPVGDIAQTGQKAPGGVPNAQNTNGMGSGGNINEISSPDVTITFSNGDGFYGFDVSPTTDNGNLNKTYETIPMKNGGTYKVNYKAISDISSHANDYVAATATFSNGKTKKDLVFKTENGTAIDTTAWTGNTVQLKLKRTLDFVKETIVATVRPTSANAPTTALGKYDIAGTMNLWHLTNKKVNVTFVSVDGYKTPTKAEAEESLNKIYQKAGISFEVTVIAQNLNWDKTLQCGNSGWFDTYTDQQNQLIANFKTSLGSSYTPNTYYLFFSAITPSRPLGGFMPLKHQFGFIFNATNATEEGGGNREKTIAHELGHGVFGLQHPFTEYNTERNSTNLLMDGGTGTVLSHNDWQMLHAPGLQLYPFIQGDKDGEYETDGHYSTVYLVSLMLGMNPYKALELAKATEAPDTTVHNETKFEINDTWGHLDGSQQNIHSLTGGFHGIEEFFTAIKFLNPQTNNTKELGELLHRFGDTYAHTKINNLKPEDVIEDIDLKNADSISIQKYTNAWKIESETSLKSEVEPWVKFFNYYLAKYGVDFLDDTSLQISIFKGKTLKQVLKDIYLNNKSSDFIMYGNPIFSYDEHAFTDGGYPDQIYVRPNWYMLYVKNLSWLISEKFKLDNSKLDTKVFSKMVLFVSKNKCSMKGIIDYEIAKKWNKKTFYIPVYYAEGRLLASGDAAGISDYLQIAKDNVENAKKYLIEQGISENKIKVEEVKGILKKINANGTFDTVAYKITIN